MVTQKRPSAIGGLQEILGQMGGTFKAGPLSFGETPESKIQKQIQNAVAKKVSVLKIDAASARSSAIVKLAQSKILFKRSIERNKEIFQGLDLPATAGIRGLSLLGTGYVIRNNEWVPTFIGDQYTTAVSLMRALIPGRAEKMIEGFKGTLPRIWSSDKEADAQLAQSMVTSLGEYASKNPGEFPEIDFTSPQGIASFLGGAEAKALGILKEADRAAALIPPDAITPQGAWLSSGKGKPKLIKYDKIDSFTSKGWNFTAPAPGVPGILAPAKKIKVGNEFFEIRGE